MAVKISGSTGLEVKGLPYLVGQVCFFAMASAPTGFLVCDGSAVSRVTYAAAFQE
jgi:microcystin-dependent protein